MPVVCKYIYVLFSFRKDEFRQLWKIKLWQIKFWKTKFCRSGISGRESSGRYCYGRWLLWKIEPRKRKVVEYRERERDRAIIDPFITASTVVAAKGIGGGIRFYGVGV